MREKINLEKILNNQIVKDFDFRLFYGESTTNNITNAMLEFGKQLLQLAAENMLLDKYYNGHYEDSSVKYSNNQGYSVVVNKQSILDTIKEVE